METEVSLFPTKKINVHNIFPIVINKEKTFSVEVQMALSLVDKSWKKRSISSQRRPDNKRRRTDDRRSEENALRIVTKKAFNKISNLFDVPQFNKAMSELTRPSIYDNKISVKKDKNIFYHFSDLILEHFNFPFYHDKFIQKNKCIKKARKFSHFLF